MKELTAVLMLVLAPFVVNAEDVKAGLPVEWIASEVMDSCDGPVQGGTPWNAPGFDTAGWQSLVLPDTTGIPGDKSLDRFYRGTFSAQPGQQILLEWSSDDGSWVYLNGEFLVHEGGECHQGGCVNMKCGNNVGGGGLIDLSSRIVPGTNTLAVHVSNGGCCGASFDAKLLEGKRVEAIDWFASEVTSGTTTCDGPKAEGSNWTDVLFSLEKWTKLHLPDRNPIPPDQNGDRFYRGYFVADEDSRYMLQLESDDGSWVFVNGKFIMHQGGECHQGGTGRATMDITPYLGQDVNVVAVHVSNAAGCCASFFDATLIETTMAERPEE